MIRVRSTASDVSSCERPTSSPRPGAIAGTSHGASSAPRAANVRVAMKTRLMTEFASRHAAASSSWKRRAKMGMNALASVAPAMSWKARSGRRKATQYAPSSGLVPN